MSEKKLYNFEKIINRITIAISDYVVQNWIKVDEGNKIDLGNVSFWFSTNKENKKFLVYTLNPNEWQIGNVVSDLEKLEYENLMKRNRKYRRPLISG